MSVHKTLHSLHHFCKEGNYERVKQILEAEGEAVLEKKRYHHADSPLLVAADAGNADIVGLLLFHGADVNSCDNWGESALHLVAAKDHTDCAKVLLSAPSIDIGLKSKVHHLTPYQKAKQYKSISVKKLLKSAEIRKLAKEAKDKEQIRKLLEELESSLSADDVTSECFGQALLSAAAVGNEQAALGILHLSAKSGAHGNLDLQACLTTALERKLLKLATIVFVCILVNCELVQELSGVLGDLGAVEQKCEFLQRAFKNVVALSLDRATVKRIRDNVNTIKCSDLTAPILFAMHNPDQEDAAKHLLWHNCLACSDSCIQWKNLSLPRLERSWFHELYQLPEGKLFYSRICKLDLRKNRLRSVPGVVFQLPLINVIYLDSNELTTLPGDFSWSRSLRSLYLSHNQLRDLPETMATAHLTTLKVNDNRLAWVSKCICELVWLEALDLSHNPGITNLPEEMGRLTNLKHLVFDEDKIISPFGWQSHAQSAQDLVRWLQALLRSSKKFTQVKLMVTGWQAKGKTTLIHRLNDDFRFNDNIATTGIQISNLKESRFWWPFLASTDHRPSFQVWDFAGHEDFYVTHMCFLSAIALYLLVWNLCDGEQGIKDLSSWLNNISARTGHSSHTSVVIIVGTHLDVVTKYEKHYGNSYVERMRQFIKTLLEERNDEHLAVVDIVEVSCSLDRPKGIDNLKNKIYSAVKVMMKSSGDGEKKVRLVDELVPHAFIVLAKRIQEMRSERLENNLPPILTRQQLRAEVSNVIRSDRSDKGRPNDPNDFQQAAQFLEERGFVLHFNDSSGLLRDLYFIDPRWLCDLMSHIITVPFTSQRKKAILNKSDLQELMQRNGFPPEYNQQYIQLLNRFQVAYSLTEQDMLVPSQLPDEKPTEVFNEENQRCYTPIQRVYSISQMPHGLFSRLIVILLSNVRGILEGSSSVDVKTQPVVHLLNKQLFCWRSGIYFRDVSLLFVVTSLPGSEASSANVRIQVSPDKGGQRALSVIIDHMEALINEWFAGIRKRSVVRTVPCHACAKTGHDAHAFNLDEFEHDDEQGEHYKCRKQNVSLPLHHVAPDLAFHDIEEEYLLHEKHLKLDQDETMRIGKGDFGTVYRGECRDKPAAIKVFNGENPYREVRKELAVLRRVVSHPNLVSMLGVGRRPLCIAMELADRGSLDRTLFSEPLVAIPRIVRVVIGREIAEALYFLHSIGIVHRDLKPANVLLYSLAETDQVHVKLSDFGTTGFITPGGLKSMVGPTAICAPEMLEFSSVGEYGPEVDVYSFAIFLYNLVTRRNAFHVLPDSGRIKECVLKKGRPPWKDAREAIRHFANLTQLMCHCWSHAPFERPTAVQVRDQLAQPFFQLLMGKVCFAQQRALLQATFLPVNGDIWFLYCTMAHCVASIFSTDKMKFEGHTSVTDHSLSKILFACSTVDLVVIFIQNSKDEVEVKLCSVASREVVKENSFLLPFKSLNGVAVCGSYLYLASSEGLYVVSVDNLTPGREQEIRTCSSEECLDVAVVSKEVWVTTRDSIHIFRACETTEAVKFHAGNSGKGCNSKQNDLYLAASLHVRETNETTRLGSTKLDVSPNGQHVWFLHHSILTKYDASTKTELLAVNCLDLLRSATNQNTQDYVTCFSPAHDTLWLGTGSGLVLILAASTGNLLAWNQPYETEVTDLIFCAGAQPSTIVSLGNRLRREALSPGDCVTCSLALEKAEVIENDKQRRVSNESGSQKRKHRGSLNDSSWTEATGSFYGVALVWEALSTEVLRRILR